MDGYEGRRRSDTLTPYEESAFAESPGGMPEEPPINSSFTSLVNNISHLDEALSALIERLQPVLNPQSDDEPGPGTVPARAKSELAHALDGQVDRIERLTAVIHSVRRRVEC